MKNRKVMDTNKSRMVIEVQNYPDMVVVLTKIITRHDGRNDDYTQELNFIQNKMFETFTENTSLTKPTVLFERIFFKFENKPSEAHLSIGVSRTDGSKEYKVHPGMPQHLFELKEVTRSNVLTMLEKSNIKLDI